MSKADELKAKNENLFERNTILLNENERLKKENEELRNNGFTVSAMTEQQLKVAIEKGEQLEKDFRICEKNADTYYDQLTKAKEIIKNCIHILKHSGTALDWKTVINQAEQFLKEIDK